MENLVKTKMQEFLNDPSAKNYRVLEVALTKYQDLFFTLEKEIRDCESQWKVHKDSLK